MAFESYVTYCDLNVSLFICIHVYVSVDLHVYLTIKFLFSLTPREFNSYGSRRGNDAVMARGTFANIRLVNKLAKKTGPRTLHIPSQEEVHIYAQITLLKFDRH